MTVILVTGTPGTGKTTLAKALSKQGFKYISVTDVVKQHKLSTGFDKEKQCDIVDESQLSRVLVGIIQKSKLNLVIDGHMSHFLPSKYADLCVVTKCELKELQARLEKKGYSKEKVRENLDSEIFDVCLSEAQEQGHNTFIVDTKDEVDVLVAQILAKVRT